MLFQYHDPRGQKKLISGIFKINHINKWKTAIIIPLNYIQAIYLQSKGEISVIWGCKEKVVFVNS